MSSRLPCTTPWRYAAPSMSSCARTGAASSVPHAYVRALREAHLRGSMGRVGACADNAATESISSLPALGQPRAAAPGDCVRIERTYPRRRRPDALGRLTLIEFQQLTQAAHAA